MDDVECDKCYGICKRKELGSHCTDDTLIPVSRLRSVIEKYEALIAKKDEEIEKQEYQLEYSSRW
jgi:hypothetical protein